MLWEGEGCRVVGEHRIETRAKELNRVCIKIVLAGLRSSWSLKRAASYAVLCLPSISGTPFCAGEPHALSRSAWSLAVARLDFAIAVLVAAPTTRVAPIKIREPAAHACWAGNPLELAGVADGGGVNGSGGGLGDRHRYGHGEGERLGGHYAIRAE